MKKALSILLIICLTVTSVFSSYTAKAEENSQSEGLVVLESDFSSTTNWIMRNQYFVKYLDENQDGTNDYARITSSTKAQTGLKSAPFVLIPGDEYELTYYVRVPNGEGGSAGCRGGRLSDQALQRRGTAGETAGGAETGTLRKRT